ncbi:VHS domain-containing protein-like isoform X1 [Iris pallida]|uniref:VHS domain-containing protein-like isoform X1 n=1 Tax=Iris pallida TaxID=29817 RepID=A0AAX6DV14_IRIPA|nr:VHS domain-containing protein-like isoform X1 [Iris pallida]
MDSSRRAVEAYWRTRMVDGVTSDEDKVAPVYKLDEICDLLRTSHAGIVKEVSDYVLKRLDHKSPVVKQKTLRLIKFAVGKSGTEFRREMQRHSAALRQLFHYKGHPDPLKGDALNKAVRDTAHEAVSAIFASDDNKTTVAPTEGIEKRIQGFGNTNYEMPTEDKKSFLSEVVGIGLSTIAAAQSIRKNENGSYKSPNLRRSLTREIDGRDRYEGDDYNRGSYASSGSSENVASGTWSQDLRTNMGSTPGNENTSSSHNGVKSREERLLETIVTSGGVRLQPTRDAIQLFLVEVSKLDAIAMSHALDMKLQSHVWQVRMKACCVLESILRKKDDEHLSIIASYFCENRDSVVKCSELPQVSLREKANKVLNLLGGNQVSGVGKSKEPSDAKPFPVPAVQMPDLIDTGEPDDFGTEASIQKQVDQGIWEVPSSGSLVDVDDLLGSGPNADPSTNGNRGEDDPFVDVSFHVTEDEQHDDIFLGLTVDDKIFDHESKTAHSNESAVFDIFSSNDDNFLQQKGTDKNNVHELMSGLSLNGTVQEHKQPGASGSFLGVSVDESSQSSQVHANGALNGSLGSNAYYPMVPVQYNMPSNMMFNPAFATQQMNYGAMGAFIAQQQLLFQNLGNINTGYGMASGAVNEVAYATPSPLPDIFQLSNNMVQSHGQVITSTKKEETKAFDFISDHLSAARDSKRVL